MSDLNIPKHVAIIMDGNRRWAKKRGLPSSMGHKEGYKIFKVIGDYCRELGVETLTIYAFSTENWKRAQEEVTGLMNILRQAIKVEKDRLHSENIRLKVIGRRSDLPTDLQQLIIEAEELTKTNTGGQVNIALSYSGRGEIVDAVKKIVNQGYNENDINEELISENIYTAGQIEPELIIRTGGDRRLSNFLLWQSYYTELYFSDILWPDFTKEDLNEALKYYSDVKRNFGA